MQVSERAGVLRIPVRRFGGANGSVSASFSTSDTSALAGVDFVGLSFAQLAWSDMDDAIRYLSVQIISDSMPEDTETFTVFIQNVQGGASLGFNAKVRGG